MSKVKTNAIETTNPSKATKNAKETKILTKANVESATLKVHKGRDSKYAYPKDITTPEQKKTFRRNARQQGKKFTTSLEALKVATTKTEKTELKKIQEEYVTFQAVTYVELGK